MCIRDRLWDAVATEKAVLLNAGIRSIPDKLERATWLNYVRCHDDIGWGFADEDIRLAGYEPRDHRKFLVEYYTGKFPGSKARGQPFAFNKRTGDARISGALASLAGLEVALEANDAEAIDLSIRTIIQLHAMILSFGGIPLLYYCLLYTSDAADERSSVDLGGRRIIKKKKQL